MTSKDFGNYILRLKDLVSKIPHDESDEFDPEAYTEELKLWLVMSLEAFLACQDLLKMISALESPDKPLLANLLKAARMLVSMTAKLESSELHLPRMELGHDSVQNWGWTKTVVEILHGSEAFNDAVNVEASKLKLSMEKAYVQVSKATSNMHVADGETNWKLQLQIDKEEHSLQELLEAASAEGSLSSLDGEKVEETINELDKAWWPWCLGLRLGPATAKLCSMPGLDLTRIWTWVFDFWLVKKLVVLGFWIQVPAKGTKTITIII